jgi:hypothetical protein
LKEIAGKIRSMPEETRVELACKYGTITAEGHALSPFNCIFLAMQAGKPLAQVGGFKQWQRVGRMVIKGQHAAGQIFVPCKRKTDDDAPDNDKPFFITRPVFDVSQTEPIEATE